MDELVEIRELYSCREALTNSRTVAEKFNKNHYDVLKIIDSYINLYDPHEDSRHDLNLIIDSFIPSEYTDVQGKKRKEYLINRDGFMLLAMGFTGKEAMIWKCKFIKAFDAMEIKLTKKAVTLDLKNSLKVYDLIVKAKKDPEEYKLALEMFKDYLPDNLLNML